MNAPSRTATAAAALSIALAFAAAPVRAGDDGPIRVEVGEAKGPVGKPTELVARLTIEKGYRFIEPPPRGNRVIELSAADQQVEFARRVFRGKTEDGSVTFRLEVTPKSAGPHPINGVFRVSYVTEMGDSYHLRHVSLPMMTTVTGIE